MRRARDRRQRRRIGAGIAGAVNDQLRHSGLNSGLSRQSR
jgi:hypothetical protein